MPMGEDMTKFREPLSMKELIENLGELGFGDEKTPEESISENWQKTGR